METLKLKLEDLRHDEKIGWWILGIDIALLMLGLCGLGFTETRIEWHGLIPYEVTYHSYAYVAIAIMLLAAFFIALGGVTAAYYSHIREGNS